ncbi:hypothetical protein QYF61_007482 [Mycteria americana]|uniref:PIK helical domain-containing protein n=1 Tax=Mycteria americana TaxID=33587 RepID=A0AAN7N8P4_MYCAM|nr:hypothetical protein QYF61_007482 [Mycteria americana]
MSEWETDPEMVISSPILTSSEIVKIPDPQMSMGSILGPVLFSIFSNDLDAGVECTISKFADDNKVGGAFDSLEGQEALQRDLDRLEHWAIINGMKLNKSKCRILHLGWSNAGHKYKLGEEWLESSPAERDLGVLVDSRLLLSQWCALAAKRANCILGCIKHSITSLSKERRTTKLVKGLEGMSYEEWLRTLGLSSLEKRRLRGDLIALYGFLKRRSGEGGADLFSLVSSDRTCGDGSKLRQGRFRLDIRKHFFTKRALTKFLKCVNWDLPQEAKQALELLGKWKPMDVEDSLELLSSHFTNPTVRRCAVARLQQADDEDLLMYLLQLVQALKYENFDDIKNGLEPSKRDSQGSMSESMTTSGTNGAEIDRQSRVVSRVTTMTQRNSLASNFINWRIPQTDKRNELASSTNEQR